MGRGGRERRGMERGHHALTNERDHAVEVAVDEVIQKKGEVCGSGGWGAEQEKIENVVLE
jgi:hypothetical protein